MQNYLTDCTKDEGIDYIFSRMAATYGASFMRHWDGVDPQVVRSVWKSDVGIYLQSRASMDYALAHMHQDFPPSSIAFKNQCLAGPALKREPVVMIEKKLTVHEQIALQRKKAEAKQRLDELLNELKGKV